MTFINRSDSTRAKLAYTQVGAKHGRRVWVLHGIMGSRQNWSRFARRLSQNNPDLTITTVDLRCHGDTEHVQAPHTIQACVEDLITLGREIGSPQVLIGHSFGGKVALLYASKVSLLRLKLGLERVWTLDSPLVADVRPGHGEVARVIEACGKMPLPCHSRLAVTGYFTDKGFSTGIAQWMTTNLRRVRSEDNLGPEGFTWKFDLSGINSLIADYWKLDGWSLLAQIQPSISVHLLRAERGLRWTDEDEERIKLGFPHVNVPLLKDSGHWVHIEQLDALIKMLGDL